MSARAAVVDASVIAAFLLREKEGSCLDSLLADVAGAKATLHVPSHFFHEILNVLTMADRRGRLVVRTRRELERDLDCFPFVTDAVPDTRIRRAISDLAFEHELTVYDAAYLELALRVGGELWTLDRQLIDLRNGYDFIRP